MLVFEPASCSLAGMEAHPTNDDPVWLGRGEVRTTWIELNVAAPQRPVQWLYCDAGSTTQPQVAMRSRPPAGGVSNAH